MWVDMIWLIFNNFQLTVSSLCAKFVFTLEAWELSVYGKSQNSSLTCKDRSLMLACALYLMFFFISAAVDSVLRKTAMFSRASNWLFTSLFQL